MVLLRRLLPRPHDGAPHPGAADPVAVLGARLDNPAAIVAAAGRAGVPVAVAAALAELETGGRNVYGHDRGGVFAAPDGALVPVTPESLAELRARVAAGERSNGVGPAQITWPPLFDRADALGLDLAEPEDNMTLGLMVLAEHARGDLSPAGLERAGTLYNAGTLAEGVTDYGRRLARAAAAWAERLGTAPDGRAAEPVPDAAGAAVQAADVHVVALGDTLWALAREHGTDVDTLRRLNPDVVPEAMPVGTRLRVR